MILILSLPCPICRCTNFFQNLSIIQRRVPDSNLKTTSETPLVREHLNFLSAEKSLQPDLPIPHSAFQFHMATAFICITGTLSILGGITDLVKSLLCVKGKYNMRWS